jgi:hypothetical protein
MEGCTLKVPIEMVLMAVQVAVAIPMVMEILHQ